MLDFVSLIIIAASYVAGYLMSLYALAVYVDPDEIETILPGASPAQRTFLVKLADDPLELMQIADIYKSFSLVLITVLAMGLLDGLADLVELTPPALHAVGLIVIWFFYIMVVEIYPRHSSRKAVNQRIFRYLWLIRSIYLVFSPVVRIYRGALKRAQPGVAVSEEDKEEIVGRAIETMAEHAGFGQPIVDEEEREMISQIFLLDQTVVREIMIPRIDIIGIEKSMSFKDIRKLVLRDGHSRYPVYEGTIDRIIGLIYVKDLFSRMPEPGEMFGVSDYLRKPYFVPETKIIGDLLREFKDKRQHIAIVVDEYGGVAGLVTLEDIIEEIFGEIQDEHDSEASDFVPLGEGHYLVSANLMVEKLQDELDTEYEQEDYDTVGGLIYDLVGSVPSEGQKIKWHDIEFEVVSVDGQRIINVRVAYKPTTPSRD